MPREHEYALELAWAGDTGQGYRGYPREHQVSIDGKPALTVSADATFLGDPAVHNPEDLLLTALASCHLLSYLALAARARIAVIGYNDRATGAMAEDGRGGGRFTRVVLHPQVVVADPADIERATALHHDANKICFIAQSVNFPVEHEPVVRAAPPTPVP